MNEFGFSGEMEDESKQKQLNGNASEPVAAIEDKSTKVKSKKDKKRD